MSTALRESIPPFIDSFATLRLAAACQAPPGPKGGRPPRVPSLDLIAALAWHVLQPAGTFSKNLAMLHGIRLSDSALSERRQSLGTQPFQEALDAFLGHRACAESGPGLGYKGFRLVGVDGTSFSVGNCRALKKLKVRTRRGQAAYFRISCVALCGLGSHQALAVKIGEGGESEAVLAARIVEGLAKKDLLIADRYYGNGKWAARLTCLKTSPRFLLRIPERLLAIPHSKLTDGSCLVHVKDPETKRLLLVREIKAKVRRPGCKWTKIRFWTNLLDEAEYPANELIALYAMRWEQEIAFYELKQHIHGEIILSSHTFTTAVQEICALFMAQAIVTSTRMAVATRQHIPILQISFQKSLVACRHLWWLWGIAGPEIGPKAWAQIVRKVEQELTWQASKPRRKRSCPRKIRQPVSSWPRLMKNTYGRGQFEYRIRKS